MLLGCTNLAYVAIPNQHILSENWRRSPAPANHMCWTCWPKHGCLLRFFTLVVSCSPQFSYLPPSRSLTFSNPLALLCFSLPSSNMLTSPILLFPQVFLLSFFPNCLWPQILSLLLQLFASIKPLDRYLSSSTSTSLPQAKHVEGMHPTVCVSEKQWTRPCIWEVLLGTLVPPGTSQSVLYLSCSCARSWHTQPCAVSLSTWLTPTYDWTSGAPHLVLPDASTCSFPAGLPRTCSVDCFPLLFSQKRRTDRDGR